MLTYLKIRNFKSLNDTEIRFSDFTVLVGNNATGKSTVLQAIDFLVKSASQDFSYLLDQRGYSVLDILSKLTGGKDRKIQFYTEWKLPADSGGYSLRWEMEIECNAKENTMRLIHEAIQNTETGRIMLDYGTTKNTNLLVIRGSDGIERAYPPVTLNSSALKIAVNTESEEDERSIPELVALKKYLIASCSYDLLSPSEMRQSSRGAARVIGSSGRNLPSYIKSLPLPAMQALQAKLHSLAGNTVESIKAHTESRPGWTRIEVTEKYGDKRVEISSKNMSDGMLRLLAFLSISESEALPCLMLLDEIENGININYAEKLIHILMESAKSKGQQIIVTTHSTVFLDYVPPENIVFLRRNDETGWTEALGMLDIAGMADRLEYLYPGEVILNMTPQERAQLLLSDGDEDGEDE